MALWKSGVLAGGHVGSSSQAQAGSLSKECGVAVSRGLGVRSCVTLASDFTSLGLSPHIFKILTKGL